MSLVVFRSVPYYLVVLVVPLVCLNITDPLATNSSLHDKGREIYIFIEVKMKHYSATLILVFEIFNSNIYRFQASGQKIPNDTMLRIFFLKIL